MELKRPLMRGVTVRNCSLHIYTEHSHFTIKYRIAILYSYCCERERCLYDIFSSGWPSGASNTLVLNSVSLSDYDYRNMYSQAGTKEQNILQDGKKSEEKYRFKNVAIMLFTTRQVESNNYW